MSKQAIDLMGTALILASRGRFVFPCLPCDKRPATARGYKDATIDPDVIRQWWHQEPNYNLAIATGAISKIFCIDLDGLDAEGELRKLEAEHGELPATVEVCTARGRHIYFQMPDVPVRNSAGKIAPGIDLRADGGYALVPPSVHPSGRTYCWSVDCTRTFAPAPDWLLAKIAEPASAKKAATPPAEWQSLVHDGVSEGKRNDSITRLAGYLLRRRVDALLAVEIIFAVNEARCRPPLERNEVIAIVDSIAAREMKRRSTE